jgi:hypothetical protein
LSWAFSCGVLSSKQLKLKNFQDSLPGNAYWKHCRGIAIVETTYQAMTTESRLRRLSVEWFVVLKSATVQ